MNLYKKTNKSTGNLGEIIAAMELKRQCGKIICRNFRQRYGEIDLVAKESDGTLIFVEVKSLLIDESRESPLFKPEDNLNYKKFKILSKTCQAFANKYPLFINNQKGWRIDLMAIRLPKQKVEACQSLTEIYKNCIISHYKNISL